MIISVIIKYFSPIYLQPLDFEFEFELCFLTKTPILNLPNFATP